MIKFTPEQYFQKFMQVLTKTQQDYTLENIHDGLILWYAEYILHLDVAEAKERIVKDEHAEGVDALFHDQDSLKLIFVQAKTVEVFHNTLKNFAESDIKKTLSGIEFLIRGDYAGKITPELENFVDEYHDLDESCLYNTQVIFLSLMQPPVDFKFVEDFRTRFPNIQIDFVNFAELQKSFEEFLVLRAPPPPLITFEVKGDLIKKEEPIRSVVFSGLGKDFARIYHEHGESIFQQNVRTSLGLKSKSINAKIYETACDENASKRFWYYNNGITMVSSKITTSNTGAVISLENAQIINGAQTAHALYRTWIDNKLQGQNVEVIVKVIETGDNDLIEAITLYTNSQNAIRLRDLCSNDDIQKVVQTIWKVYGYFYERKRGEFESLFKTAEDKIKQFGIDYKQKVTSNEEVAQAYLAFYLDMPAEAKNEKSRIFSKESGGFYSTIFDIKCQAVPERLLLSWIMFRLISKKKTEYVAAYKTAIKSGNEEIKQITYELDFLLHAEYFILNLFPDFLGGKMGFNVNGDKLAIDLIIAELQKPNQLFSDIYSEIINLMKPHFIQLKLTPRYYHNKFFKSRNSLSSMRKDFNSIHSWINTI